MNNKSNDKFYRGVRNLITMKTTLKEIHIIHIHKYISGFATYGLTSKMLLIDSGSV